MHGRQYIMKKLNREKTAATEERKKELELKGYSCIGVKESGPRDGEEETGQEREPGKQDGKQVPGKASGKRTKTDDNAGEGGKDGNGTDGAGKD